MRRTATRHDDLLVIGVDASADGFRAASRKASAKPARGGLGNALFGRLSLEDAPGELVGLADGLTVLLPWGGLLGAVVARPDGRGITSLRAICKVGAEVRIVFGYGPRSDGGLMREKELPALEAPAALTILEGHYREAGFAVAARWASLDEVRALPTTWAKRLAFSTNERLFVELRGRALAP